MIAVEALIIFILILINGAFALMELSLVSSRRSRLQKRAEEGDQRARIALEFLDEPSRFLSTVQIGISLVGIMAGAFGGATLSHELGSMLLEFGIQPPYDEIISFALVVLGITYFTLVFGELVPKRIALINPTSIAIRVSPVLRILGALTMPFTKVLSASTEFIIRILGINTQSDVRVSDEEITMLLKQGISAGQFREAELNIVEQLFRLSDRVVSTIMTPRSEIVWLSSSDAFDTIQEKVAASDLSQFPVCHNDLDDVYGIISVRALFKSISSGATSDIFAKLQEPAFVSEQASVLKVIEHMSAAKSNNAVVVDEYGSVQGLVTKTDILNSLLSDVLNQEPSHSIDSGAMSDEMLLDGQLSIDELCERLAIRELPEGWAQVQTLAGLAMVELNEIPSEGDRFAWGGFQFTVVEMDGHRVKSIRVQGSGEESAEDT